MNLNVIGHTTIVEHHAPTDESVKLLRELEIAAENKVKAAIRLQDCIIDCVLHKIKQPLNGMHDVLYVIHFRLNNKDFECEVHITDGDYYKGDAVIEKIHNELALVIAGEILQVGFDKLKDHKFFD